MGVLAALGGAISWAVASTVVGSQAAHLGSLSIVAWRSLWALLFFIVALFALGAEDDLARMTLSDLSQLGATGLLSQAAGETVYVLAIVILGMSRAFTTAVGAYAVLAYVLSFFLLDESVTWLVAIGSALAITGVAIVALYGRATPSRSPAAVAPQSVNAALPPGANVASTPSRVPLTPHDARRQRVGLLLAVATGVFWASSAVWLRDASEGFNAAAVGLVRFVAVSGALLLVVVLRAAIAGRGLRAARFHYPRGALLSLALTGAFGIGLGSLLLIFAVQEIGAGPTAVVWSSSPLFALPLAAVFLGERLTVWLVLGTLLAVAGIILLS